MIVTSYPIYVKPKCTSIAFENVIHVILILVPKTQLSEWTPEQKRQNKWNLT